MAADNIGDDLSRRPGFLQNHPPDVIFNGIPYTGAPPFALALCRRKGLHYHLIVKPAREDASTGVEKESVVYDRELHVLILGGEPPRVLPMIEYDFSELPDEPARGRVPPRPLHLPRDNSNHPYSEGTRHWTPFLQQPFFHASWRSYYYSPSTLYFLRLPFQHRMTRPTMKRLQTN